MNEKEPQPTQSFSSKMLGVNEKLLLIDNCKNNRVKQILR